MGVRVGFDRWRVFAAGIDSDWHCCPRMSVSVCKRHKIVVVEIVSLVRRNAEGLNGVLGRLPDGPRRLNVAMTRAQRLCVLVGPEGREDASALYAELASLLRDTGRMKTFDAGLL